MDAIHTADNDLHLTLPDTLPRTVWIELTSKCPYDCVFCSRKHERGNGEHMDFELYRSLIRQLDKPDLIRLNYSGESMHYPRLPEAIELAQATGATTELVTALSSAPLHVLESVVDAGLHRLSVSLHSMEESSYRDIYRLATPEHVRERIDHLRRYKSQRGTRFPEIDFAFVAMDSNLTQLRGVAEYAREVGVRQISVHPVIRRSDMPVTFPTELDESGELRDEFAARVRDEAFAVARAVQAVSIVVARPETPQRGALHGIPTCEQNPWNTMHVLADGRIVVCEVQDRVTVGDLREQSLSGIWHGVAYAEFRRSYLNGSHPVCRDCAWRGVASQLDGQRSLVRGWHPANGDTAQWSEPNAAIATVMPDHASAMRVSGILPPGSNGKGSNTLSIQCAPLPAVEVVNHAREPLAFETEIPLANGHRRSTRVVTFKTREAYCPAERGDGDDLRRLGFALTGFTFEYSEQRKRTVQRVLRLLERVECVSALRGLGRFVVPKVGPAAPGVSVIVPARDTPDLLEPTLAAAQVALERVSEPSEIVVVVSGTSGASCAELVKRYANVRWVFESAPMDYAVAVERGLRVAAHAWVYLLNSDMHVRPRAIETVLRHRSPETFAVGSRIVMADGSLTETNWTDLRYHESDAAELVEHNPTDLFETRGCLYVGGGSGLFRASLLRRFIRVGRAYAPFYWEDAEWGALAWRHGYRCVFCPESEAVHSHRQTVSRYYSEQEVSRVFGRNRLLFHMRNLGGVSRLEKRLLSLDEQSWREVFRTGAVLETIRARIRAYAGPCGEDILIDRWRGVSGRGEHDLPC